MNRLTSHTILILFACYLLLLPGEIIGQRKIAGFGSSVCNGTGDELQLGGYIGRFKEIAARHGWQVISVSRGGDNTTTIQDRWEKTNVPPKKPVNDDQYLLPADPDYVIIGLSLANEGIRKDDKSSRDSVYERFKNGIIKICRQCDSLGIKVVIANCYPHSFYTPEQYELIKSMNLFINSLPYPGINLLGTIDDGQGHWTEGFYRDEGHPSSGGHREMTFAIVPTLFKAIESGKLEPPLKLQKVRLPETKRFGHGAILTSSVADTMHSFTISADIGKLADGKIFAIEGVKAVYDTSEYIYKDKVRKGVNIRALDDKLILSIIIEGNKINYYNDGFLSASIELPKIRSGRLTLSYSASLGVSSLYLNENRIMSVNGLLIPSGLHIENGDGMKVKDVIIYRSALNGDEIKTLCEGTLIKSSLEIYSPLDQVYSSNMKEILNLAQSGSKLIIK